MRQSFEITEQDANLRLDVFLTERLRDLSRSHIQKLILTHAIRINGDPAKSGYKTREGDQVEIDIPAAQPLTSASPEPIPLNIVHEDDDLIVINKPKGMVVHPAPGAETGTLVNALMYHCTDLSGIGGVLRPGIVHRLDKDTTGLLVVAKNDVAHRSLAEQIKQRTAVRKYQLLVWGRVPFKHAVIDAPIARHPVDRKRMTVYEDIDTATRFPRRPLDKRLPPFPPDLDDLAQTGPPEEFPPQGLREGMGLPGGARAAVTELRLLEHLGIFSWMEAILQTGRTHQIRVHTAFAGYPVVGDVIYGGMRRISADELRGPLLTRLNDMIAKLRGQCLHAYSLSFTHPRTGNRLQFHAELPPEIAELVDFLRRIDEEA
ncbi:MAG: RluA family pseudouridine synthase [Capsulimonadaceae bacterium]|nr:RluA family pseudouridine synthase [Capsulimonadaceae bacterium]